MRRSGWLVPCPATLPRTWPVPCMRSARLSSSPVATPTRTPAATWSSTPTACCRSSRTPPYPTANDHGTGCTFSAALAVHLGRGAPLVEGVAAAQSFVAAALRKSVGWRLGRGRGPVAHTIAHTVAHTFHPSLQEA